MKLVSAPFTPPIVKFLEQTPILVMKSENLLPFLAWLAVILFVSPLVASSERWPQFRGVDSAGSGGDQRVPVNLSKETLRWSVRLPGPGTSSPVVWDDKLFLTAEVRAAGRTELVRMDAKSGAIEWTRSIEGGDYQTHKFNNLASGTPCVTEDLVIVGWLDVGSEHAKLTAFTHDGDRVWTADLGFHHSQHGVSFNPVASGDRVFVNHAHMGGGFTAAYRLEDGRQLWTSPNPDGAKTSYVAPLVRELDGTGAKEVIQVGELIGMIGFDYETGAINWSLPDAFNHRTISSPVIINGNTDSNEALIAAGNKNGHFFAARVPKIEDGKIAREPRIEWAMESRAPYVPTPVSDGETFYALHDGGTLTAMEAETGVVRWQGKLLGNFYASPVLVDGKLYCLSRSGEMWVVEAGNSFNVLRTAPLNPPEDVTWTDATPAVAHNRLYVRMGSRLDCY